MFEKFGDRDKLIRMYTSWGKPQDQIATGFIVSSENTQYEQYVRNITEALLLAQGLQTVLVQHNVKIQGTSRAHQIDVYWEYRLGGVLHRVIIDCKRYADTVQVTDVLTLSGVLADMPGVRGVIVTTVGFQKGAIEYATQHQIGLKVIRPPQDADWEGRIRTINMHMQIGVPELLSCEATLDSTWIAANTAGDLQALAGPRTHDARATFVRDIVVGTVDNMNALWNRAMRENPTLIGGEGEGVLRWEDARLEEPGAVPLKVNSIHFKWRIRTGHPQKLTIRSEPAAIVRDAIDGTLLFVDPNGQITGDVHEGLGGARK